MLKGKILSILGILCIIPLVFFSIFKDSEYYSSKDAESTTEELIKDTNFKLEFKSLSELEFTVQDSSIDVVKNNGTNKSFSKNNKFNISINDLGKISSISFSTNLNEIDNTDMEYLQKVYNFIFGNISQYMFEKTEAMLQNIQSANYINLNKNAISNNGYTIESINLNSTSELRFTSYYKKVDNETKAYKITLDILQGNKW